MRRVPLRPRRIPGSLDVTLKIPRPVAGGQSREGPPCEPGGDCVEAVDGIFWYNNADDIDAAFPLTAGTYPPTIDNEVTAADLALENGQPNTGDGVYLWIAAIKGQTCGCVPEWDASFSGSGDEPLPLVVGDVLILLYDPASTTYDDATITVSATCNGVVYGPITLTHTNEVA